LKRGGRHLDPERKVGKEGEKKTQNTSLFMNVPPKKGRTQGKEPSNLAKRASAV